MIYHFEVIRETGGADFKFRRYFMTYLQFTQQPSGQLDIVWYTTKRSDKKQSFFVKKKSQLCRNMLAKLYNWVE